MRTTSVLAFCLAAATMLLVGCGSEAPSSPAAATPAAQAAIPATAIPTLAPLATGSPVRGTPVATGSPVRGTPPATGSPVSSTPLATGSPARGTPLATTTAARANPFEPVAPAPFRPQATGTARPTASAVPGAPFVLADLQATMLQLINQDRDTAGLAPVAWDAVAAETAQAHAYEMLDNGYLSHWNLAGHGPDQRYALAGGLDAVFENLHASSQRYSDGRAAPVSDWQARLAEVEKGFMTSAGHSQNILDPAHTHAGVGIAYDPASGELRLVQEFVNRYAEIGALPAQASPGTVVSLRGRLLRTGLEPVLGSVACEPVPTPMTASELDKTGAYTLPGGMNAGEAARQLKTSGDQVQDSQTIPANSKPGQCYVRVWVTINGRQVLAVDRLVEVP